MNTWQIILIVVASVFAGLVLLIALFVVLGFVLRQTGGYAPGWQLRCRKCNATWDAGEIGVIRINAVSRGKRTYGRCANCRKRGWMAIEKKPEAAR